MNNDAAPTATPTTVTVSLIDDATAGGLDIQEMERAPRFGDRVNIGGRAYAVVCTQHRSRRTIRAVVRPI